jgi:hypothetical protein
MACSQSLTGKASTGSELIGSYQIGVLDLLASIAWFRIHYHTCVHTQLCRTGSLCIVL